MFHYEIGQDAILLFDDRSRTIAAFNPYGFVDPDTLEPLGVFFDRGAADSGLLARHWRELAYGNIEGFDIGCAVVDTQAGPSFAMAVEDEDDGPVLLALVTDYGFDDGHLVVSLFDGDEERERLFDLVWEGDRTCLVEK